MRSIGALSYVLVAVGVTSVGGTIVVADDSELAVQIAAAGENATIAVPSGTHLTPLRIEKSLTLKGVVPDECILDVTADRPALSVSSKANVVVESMTIRWQLDSSQPDPGPPTAISAKDANLTLRNCRIIAKGNGKRCPSGVMADGFSNLTLENCQIEGFEFAVNISGGAEGVVADCVVRSPGHCGLSVFSGSTLTVNRSIVTGSAFHAVRSSGGVLKATDNLIIQNRNRGFYLGNKSAKVSLSGNVLIGNGSGISSFAQTEGTIEHNVILDSDYSGIDSRETCAVVIRDNILQGNERGVVLFAESGNNRVSLESNTFWDNASTTVDIEAPQTAINVDPEFKDRQQGQFEALASEVSQSGHGLADGAVIATLWRKWRSLADVSLE